MVEQAAVNRRVGGSNPSSGATASTVGPIFHPGPRSPSRVESASFPAVAEVHLYVYIQAMKRRELERRLRESGWTLHRHGGKHDVWISASGSFTEYVPRHPEINETLARVILRRAKERR